MIEVEGLCRWTIGIGRLRTVCVRSVNLDRLREISAMRLALRGCGSILSN